MSTLFHPLPARCPRYARLLACLGAVALCATAVAGLYTGARTVLLRDSALARMQDTAHQAFDTMQAAMGSRGAPLCAVEVAHGGADASRLPGLSQLGTDMLKTAASARHALAGRKDCGMPGALGRLPAQGLSGHVFFIGRMHSDAAGTHGGLSGDSGLLHCRYGTAQDAVQAAGMRCRMLARDAVDFQLEAIHGPAHAAWQQHRGAPRPWDPSAPLRTTGPQGIRAIEVRLLMASSGDRGPLAPQSLTQALHAGEEGSPGILGTGDGRLYRAFSTVLQVTGAAP